MILPQPHCQFETRWPDEGRYAQELDRQRRARGLASLREFPCRGVLNVWGDPNWPMLDVCCDGCGFETTIRNPSRREQESDTGSYRGAW